MKCNIGKTDKAVRWIVGLIIIVLGIIFDSWWGLIGLLPIATAFLGFCGLYSLLGISTTKPKWL
ncbi:MAG: DUF2892 domain-containing protein [candidate division Zixibacteria bacterium CG_4_9_14_3_um_filter_46_8]|nr:MAG: DUF2892 domain-containing protein [candidate division Zixibacteria bacterium CG_4_9_14_3_um_filter_46_8]